jgi:hypothetical protein
MRSPNAGWSIFTPNDLIRGKEMCFCSQLKVCNKRLVRKLSAGSGSAVYFDTTVVPHDFLTLVRPAKAGMFSGRQSHQGNSHNPVAWVAFVEETKRMKPTDKAILGMVSELPGRNESEPTGGLDKI